MRVIERRTLHRRGARELLAASFLEGLEGEEDDARIGRDREAVHRETGEGDGVLDARVLERDRGHAPDHGLGAVERGGVGQLREGHEADTRTKFQF